MSYFRNSWQRLEPLQKGFLLGLVVGALVAVLTRQLYWIAVLMPLGAGGGWLIGTARTRSEEGQAGHDIRPRAGGGRREDTSEDQGPLPGPPPVPGRTTAAPPSGPAPVVDRERDVVTRARAENVLNGVFTLTLFNRRHTGPRRSGQEPVDVHAALGDLHDSAAIEDAILGTAELLAHAQDLALGARDARNDRAELQQSHPGFSPEHLSEALNWGYRNGR